MRVIAGTCKGRRLVAPKGLRVRPALDRVKESVFSILYDVEGLTVLDLYAGTGSVGIEALSRGAVHATFVERDPVAHRSLIANIEACGLGPRATVWKIPVATALNRLDKTGKTFDLIFVDPPYLKNEVNLTLRKIGHSTICGKDTIIVIEHHPKEPIEEIPGLTLTDPRKYGQTLITFMQKT